MWLQEQEVDLRVVVDRKTNKQADSVEYLCGTMCEDGGLQLKKQPKGKSLRGSSLCTWVGNTCTDWGRSYRKQMTAGFGEYVK